MSDWDYFGRGLQNDFDAAQLVAKRVGWLREHGWRLRWSWDRKAPLGVQHLGGGGYYVDGGNSLIDHAYRLVKPDGEVIYVSEPYWLHDFDELARLDGDGWKVVVSSTYALWYPGHTVAIQFTRR